MTTTFKTMKEAQGPHTVGYALSRAHYYLRTLASRLLRDNDIPLTYEQWIVLKTVNTYAGQTQSFIGEKCHKDKTNITRMVDLLERDGFVNREKDEEDRRKYLLYPSNDGKAVLEKTFPLIKQIDKICESELSTEENELLIRLINKVGNKIKEVAL